MAAFDDLVGEIELAIEFQRPPLARQRPRRGSRLRGLVDDPNLDALLREPEREHQPRGARADDQNLAAVHRFLHLSTAPPRFPPRGGRWPEGPDEGDRAKRDGSERSTRAENAVTPQVRGIFQNMCSPTEPSRSA